SSVLCYVSYAGILVGFASYKSKNKYIASICRNGIPAIFIGRSATIGAFYGDTYPGDRLCGYVRSRNTARYGELLLLDDRYLVGCGIEANGMCRQYTARQEQQRAEVAFKHTL